MITSLKACTKSAGLIVGSPITKANANDISVLPVPTPPNFRGSNIKKMRRQSWRRASCIRCHSSSTVNDKRLLQRSMYRRQFLLASTSLPLQPKQMMTAAMPPPLSLTDYHKLTNAVQEAEKLKKTSYSPLKALNSKSPDELSGVIAVPRAEQLPREMNETEVVTARIRRAAALKRIKEKDEQLVLQGIEITNGKPLCFHVYIRLGQEPEDEEEYVGTFSHMPPCRKQRGCRDNKQEFDGDRDNEQKRVRRCCLRLGINGILIRPHNLINAYQEGTVIVNLVPAFKFDDDPIKVESIFIDYT